MPSATRGAPCSQLPTLTKLRKNDSNQMRTNSYFIEGRKDEMMERLKAFKAD